MSEYTFQIECLCCSIVLLAVTGADAAAWKQNAAEGGHLVECLTCGCRYRTVDDGDLAGGVEAQDESPPRATSLGATVTGGLAGGTTVRVNGHAFGVAAPTVKFNGVAGTGVVVVNDGALDVTTPAGTVGLNLTGGPWPKLTHGSVTNGPFVAGEVIDGATSGATGTVKYVGAGYLLIEPVAGTFQNGEVVDGATSAASATLSSALTALPFQVGETVTGQTSGKTATVSSALPLRVSGVTSGGFSASEQIQGGTSTARALLTATPHNGAVDVTVESVAWGTSSSGNRLPAAFSYVP
jgi:hypothetical protein